MNQQILIVDDEPDNLKVLGNLLNERGYFPIFADSGVHALDVLKEENPHLILLDIRMPGMDGFEVCEKIKQDASTKDIPVIFLTAETEQVLKGFRLGAVDYVTKPFKNEELITRVETHLKLKATEEQLREKVAELKEANATKDKFFSIIAHDLKNLFNGLVGLSNLLTDHQIPASKNETFLRLIQQTSENGFDLLENLLEWSGVQTGIIKAQPGTLHLEVTVDTNIDLLENQAKQKNINMVSHVKNTSVFADEPMLNTVIRNLLSNAVKFTPKNGEIEISSQKVDAEVEISIKDTGVGIEPEGIDNLFRIDVKHFTTKGTANEPGTGLGLILCKEFVEQNGGTIGVESEKGKGSRFWVRIPSSIQ